MPIQSGPHLGPSTYILRSALVDLSMPVMKEKTNGARANYDS